MDFRKGHWGPNGHITVAEAICHFLIDGGYISMLNQTPK